VHRNKFIYNKTN